MTTSNFCVFCIHRLLPPLFQPSFECFYPYAQATSRLSTTVTTTTTTTTGGGGGNPLPWRWSLRCDSCCGRFKRRRKSSMMCRSARLTRLRTAKHGSGISGKPVMVHRCQGEYFRQLLKPIT